jgi:hypothetical protein
MTTKKRGVPRLERARKPLSLATLQMMVMSGVVRRADLNPPSMPARFPAAESPHGTFPQESASEQGWLSRMFLGRKAAVHQQP